MFQIKHRHTGAVLYEADADSLRQCVEMAVRERANLADANLAGADLRGTDLRDADLRGTDLGDADLRGTDLRGADLRDADLRDANVIDAGQDCRGYRFVAVPHDDGLRIAAGCRWFTPPEARAHWTAAHADDPALRAECLAKVELIEAVAKARGWRA